MSKAIEDEKATLDNMASLPVNTISEIYLAINVWRKKNGLPRASFGSVSKRVTDYRRRYKVPHQKPNNKNAEPWTGDDAETMQLIVEDPNVDTINVIDKFMELNPKTTRSFAAIWDKWFKARSKMLKAAKTATPASPAAEAVVSAPRVPRTLDEALSDFSVSDHEELVRVVEGVRAVRSILRMHAAGSSDPQAAARRIIAGVLKFENIIL